MKVEFVIDKRMGTTPLIRAREIQLRCCRAARLMEKTAVLVLVLDNVGRQQAAVHFAVNVMLS